MDRQPVAEDFERQEALNGNRKRKPGPVSARYTDEGLRALSRESPIRPEIVHKYLEGKSGDALEDVSKAMLELARSLPLSELAEKAYSLYEKFRPHIPPGKKGWGAPASWIWTSSARWLRVDH
jgi:hypothetical protein